LEACCFLAATLFYRQHPHLLILDYLGSFGPSNLRFHRLTRVQIPAR
jgi:hypothetical protein